MFDPKSLKRGDVIENPAPLMTFYWIVLEIQKNKIEAITFTDWGARSSRPTTVIMDSQELSILKKEKDARVVSPANADLFDAIFEGADDA